MVLRTRLISRSPSVYGSTLNRSAARMRSLPSSNRYNILAVLTQHGGDFGAWIEGEGNAGFYESGLANFQRVELMAGRFIGLSESVIYGLLKVNTAMHSRP